MLPLSLDLARIKVLVIGEGVAALRRLELLDAAGARDLTLHAERPDSALARRAGDRLVRQLPDAGELAAARLVFLSDRTAAATPCLAAAARAAGALVHVEDAPALSDLHAPAVLRRGDLTIAVSTAGLSPALALRLKRFLGEIIGPEWGARLARLAALRQDWRRAGADAGTLSCRTEDMIARERWLPARAPERLPPRRAA